jgi:hypothetical protein
MITCKSPCAIMRAAHELGQQLFDEHSHKFSRKDFTLAQLFACLALREHQKKSYRGVEALLVDCSDLRDAVGLARAPDHNTIWRAFEHLVKPGEINRALDLMAARAKAKGLRIRGDSIKPAVLDSTCFESRHVSRHFEKRQRQTAEQAREKRGNNLQNQRSPRSRRSPRATVAAPARSSACPSSRSPSPADAT